MNRLSIKIQNILLVVLLLSSSISCGPVAYGLCISACMGTIYLGTGAAAVATGGAGLVVAGPIVGPSTALCAAKCAPLLAAPTP